MGSSYEHANEIIPGLWLGNKESAEDLLFLKLENINLIINASKHIPCYFKFLDYYRVSVNDPGPGMDMNHPDIFQMYLEFSYLINLIQDYRNQKKNILVHCHSGIQRSAGIVLIYLIFSDPSIESKWEKYRKNYYFLLSKRPIVFYGGQSINFEKAINLYIQENF